MIAGTRGTGKTDFMKNEIVAISPIKRRLIVDTFDNPVWRTMKTHSHPEWADKVIDRIDKKQLKDTTPGTFRVYSSYTNEMFKWIQKEVTNTLVVFEDATRYIGDKLSDDVNNFCVDCKQKNVDLVFVFHSLAQVPKDLIRLADYQTIFKTNDSWDSFLKTKFRNPLVEEAFNLVNADPNRYANLTVDFGG
jgi:ABC-type sugar transport system ATPase subunit